MGSASAGENVGCNSGNGSSGTDKAIARLLYAMLRQKSLKDIDWDQVARDPALLEEISNGHAARMRFSRFRTTVENQGKSRRSRLSSGSTSSTVSTGFPSTITGFRVTKPKRDAKDRDRDVPGQRGVPKWRHETNVKMEDEKRDSQDDNFRDDRPAREVDNMDTALPSLPLSPPRESTSGMSRIRKRKASASSIAKMQGQQAPHASASQTQLPYFVPGHSGYGSHALVRSLSASSAPEVPSQLRMRHLTPCSDIDQATSRAATDAFDFNTATAAAASIAAAHYGSSAGHEPAWMVTSSHQNHPQQQQQQQQQPSPFSPSLGDFDMAVAMDPTGLTSNHFCQAGLHQQQQLQQGSICLPGYAMDHPSMAPHAFSRHCSGWDTLLTQVSNHQSQGHSQHHNI